MTILTSGSDSAVLAEILRDAYGGVVPAEVSRSTFTQARMVAQIIERIHVANPSLLPSYNASFDPMFDPRKRSVVGTMRMVPSETLSSGVTHARYFKTNFTN